MSIELKREASMRALTASLVVVSLGCGPTVKNTDTLSTPPGAFLITAEQIGKSGARTAWQVLKQSAPMLQTSEDRNGRPAKLDRKSTRLNSSHLVISYAVFCLKKKKKTQISLT